MRRGISGLLFCLLPAAAPAEFEFDFDAGAYERKPYEVSGYLQGIFEHFALDRDAALYALNFPDEEQRTFKRYRATANVSGSYRWGETALRSRFQADWRDDVFGNSGSATVQELYLGHKFGDRLAVQAGKQALRWGTGYAWSPTAFLERPKDPTDPDLAREGFLLAQAEYVRSYYGPLRTVVLNPLLVPVAEGVNSDFGAKNALNPAARIYMLYRDTDIHLTARASGSRPGAVGIALSRNLAANFAIHGELASFGRREVSVLNGAGALVSRDARTSDWLLGFRYLTRGETTWIVEYYHSGTGYKRSEIRDFFDRIRYSADDPAMELALRAARAAGYGAPQAMRDYLYVRVRHNEPWGLLYWAVGGTSIVNLVDGSASLFPEVTYTGIPDLELRGRFVVQTGGRNTEFGERQQDWRLELRVRYNF